MTTARRELDLHSFDWENVNSDRDGVCRRSPEWTAYLWPINELRVCSANAEVNYLKGSINQERRAEKVSGATVRVRERESVAQAGNTARLPLAERILHFSVFLALCVFHRLRLTRAFFSRRQKKANKTTTNNNNQISYVNGRTFG